MFFNRSTDVSVNMPVQRMEQFGIVDYGIFIAMLVLSSVIGLYFGVRDKQQNKQRNRRRNSIEMDYMVGGRKMAIFPIAMSLAASWISSVALVGMPTEIYLFGTEFIFMLIPITLAAICVHFIFIPIYLELKLTSLNEYLEARFDRKMRYMGAFIFILTNILFMPIILYAAALAFNQVSGINIHIITPITCLVCIFYTTLGGMKAVVWTDLVQIIIMYGSLILIVIKGTIEVGGFNTVWQRNFEGNRIVYPSFTFDPIVRHSIPGFIIGGTFQALQAISTNQSLIQRYVSLPNKKAALKSLWIFTLAVLILLSLCCYNGLLIYANYHDCDPVATKLVRSKDQLLSVLVMNVLKDLPGIAGLFVSGIFSASLSTLSTTLNSLSTVILLDFIKTSTNRKFSNFTTNIIMRGIVIILGLTCIGLVFVVEKFGAILQFKITLISCTTGPLFGIFLIGMLLPWINSNSALFGGIFSLIAMIYITVKAQLAILSKEIVFAQKPTSTHGCTHNYTSVMSELAMNRTDPVAPQIYHVSYLWYVFIGSLITIIVAGFASFILGWQKSQNVNPVLLAPFIRKYFKTEDHMIVKAEKRKLNDKADEPLSP